MSTYGMRKPPHTSMIEPGARGVSITTKAKEEKRAIAYLVPRSDAQSENSANTAMKSLTCESE